MRGALKVYSLTGFQVGCLSYSLAPLLLQALALVEAAHEAQEALEQGGLKLLPAKEEEEAADLQAATCNQGALLHNCCC